MNIGPKEILFILLIVLILFGAGKLPKVMGELGDGIRNFRNGVKDGGESKENKESASLEKAEDSSEEKNG